jgi:hypothetical protein
LHGNLKYHGEDGITDEADGVFLLDVSHGPAYGETLTWQAAFKPAVDLQLVHVQMDLDMPKFSKMFVDLMSASTPRVSEGARQ